jgi:co-chaperonin GroES (HSP10)
MNIRLLRGQVVIRENLTADTNHYRHIVIPDVSDAEKYDADARQRARKWHRGTVLAMGAPMLSKTGAEIVPEFKVGDEVLFHWQHREKSWTREWIDGLLACWVPQAFVDAVLEAEHEPLVLR